jgi:hypothetical protein
MQGIKGRLQDGLLMGEGKWEELGQAGMKEDSTNGN